MNNSNTSDLSSDESEEKEELSTQRRQLRFLRKFQSQEINFQKTWLNKVTQDAKNKIAKKIQSQVGNKAEKFKYLFQVPLVVTDPKLVRRKKTYEVFSKNQQLEMYYMQLKKAKGIAKTISQKADYKEVISQINNDKIQDKNFEKFRRDRGLIYTNELWSQKHVNQIYDQSRLKELSELLELKKIKMSYDEQLLQFEKFFHKQQNKQEKPQTNVQQLVQQIKSAFGTPQSTPTPPPKPTLLSYFKKKEVELGQTQDYSTKCSRMASRNQSKNQISEYSFFSRRGSTSQIGQRRRFYDSQHLSSPIQTCEEVLRQTSTQKNETKDTVNMINNFIKQEQEVIQTQNENKQLGYKLKQMKGLLQQRKTRQFNSYIAGRLNQM